MIYFNRFSDSVTYLVERLTKNRAYSYTRICKRALILLIPLFIVGCKMTEYGQPTARKTLTDLANEQQSIEIERVKLDREQRASKLRELYKTILTLEPDPEVKAQIEYRIVQMNTQAYESLGDEDFMSEAAVAASAKSLDELIVSYQDLIQRFPERADNEWMQYQLSKALDLQGKSKESLKQMELLLAKYPNSQYAAELHFRRGDIYYNFQVYPAALSAYQAVSTANNNDKYYINSRYMSAWVLFKLNRLPEADIAFISLLDYIVAQESRLNNQATFTFEQLDSRFGSLIADVQRVLSISLSQQAQSESLVALVKNQSTQPVSQLNKLEQNEPEQGLKHLALYQHILFNNLATFLIDNQLKYDAELTYQAYITLEPNSIWAARYSIALLELLQQQGKYSASRKLQHRYVQQFGLNSEFWQIAYGGDDASVNKPMATEAAIIQEIITNEVLLNLLRFSYQYSRRLYAAAQKIKPGNKRIKAFINTSAALATYLQIAKLPDTNYQKDKPKQSKSIISDELLFADSSFEAEQYQQALTAYQLIAYGEEQEVTLGEKAEDNQLKLINQKQIPIESKIANTQVKSSSDKVTQKVRVEAAYASTLTTRAMLSAAKVKATDNVNTAGLNDKQKYLLLTRNKLDHLFIEKYPEDPRVFTLATQAAQYSYSAKDYRAVAYYSDFILTHHITGFDKVTFMAEKSNETIKLSKTALKQVQIVSQLQANSYYHQKQYQNAESAYEIALVLLNKSSNKKSKKRKELRRLLASCIYFQAESLVKEQPLQAVEHYLRIGKRIPESTYRLNSEFDAGNILLAQQQWQRGISVLTAFKKRYPKHEYSKSISAKLAKAYESTEQWELAATQLLAMITGPESAGFSKELKREAQYTAAEYYQKANNDKKALLAFRTYAHQYPEPFDIAQEVRLKMSDYYQKMKDANKQHFWYRKIVKYHDRKLKNSASEITARAEYLASFAAIGLGKAHQQTFTWVKLNLPLSKNLKRKQAAMKSAIGYYQKVLSYQLAEFVPQASFNLAQMYSILARDILASERPSDLDELELEEYEFVLEDIALPFEDKAIEIHTNNAQRAWQDVFDKWVEQSFTALAEIDPAQYNKKERISHVIPSIY